MYSLDIGELADFFFKKKKLVSVDPSFCVNCFQYSFYQRLDCTSCLAWAFPSFG